MKAKLFNDHFQNFKRYQIPKAQLIIADIPYNIGIDAYASNPAWYKDGDNSNGESELAGKEFFDTDKDFKPAEFMHFCSKMLKKEPAAKPAQVGENGKRKRRKSQSPCMIVFCAFEQQMYLIELAARYGLKNYINLVFRKNFSAQVLKANMKVVGNCEYGLIFYRDKLPKFNNKGKMVMNCMDWVRDPNTVDKIHPTQKPVALLKNLINIFSDPGDVVVDPVAGSGSTLIASIETKRKGFGFEIKKPFFNPATEWINKTALREREIDEYGFAKTEVSAIHPILF